MRGLGSWLTVVLTERPWFMYTSPPAAKAHLSEDGKTATI